VVQRCHRSQTTSDDEKHCKQIFSSSSVSQATLQMIRTIAARIVGHPLVPRESSPYSYMCAKRRTTIFRRCDGGLIRSPVRGATYSEATSPFTLLRPCNSGWQRTYSSTCVHGIAGNKDMNKRLRCSPPDRGRHEAGDWPPKRSFESPSPWHAMRMEFSLTTNEQWQR
jgi:hypothetical protein